MAGMYGPTAPSCARHSSAGLPSQSQARKKSLEVTLRAGHHKSKLQVLFEIHTPFVRAAVSVSTHITVSCSSALLHRLRPRTTHHARQTTHAASRARSIPLPTQPTRPAGSTLSVSLVGVRRKP